MHLHSRGAARGAPANTVANATGVCRTAPSPGFKNVVPGSHAPPMKDSSTNPDLGEMNLKTSVPSGTTGRTLAILLFGKASNSLAKRLQPAAKAFGMTAPMEVLAAPASRAQSASGNKTE